MSTSSVSTNSGAVALDSAIRRAIVCCSRVSSSIVVSPRPVPRSPETTGAGTSFFFSAGFSSALPSSFAGASSALPPPFCAAASTSDFTIRPPGPVPFSEPRSTPSSCAIRRATGEAFTRPLPSPVAVGRLALLRRHRRRLGGLLLLGLLRVGRLRGVLGAPARLALGARGLRLLLGLLGLLPGLLLGPGVRLARVLVARVVADLRDRRADGERVALLGHDLQRPGLVGLVRHVGLVRLDLDELLAALHRVPVGLQPLQDRALLHGVGQAGHRDVGHARRVYAGRARPQSGGGPRPSAAGAARPRTRTG